VSKILGNRPITSCPSSEAAQFRDWCFEPGEKNKPENHIRNFGQGAVYFGRLGTVLGLIAITGTPSFVWGDVEKIGPALAVAMLTISHGYMVKLETIAPAEG